MSTSFYKAFINKLESITALSAIIGDNNVWTAPVDATQAPPYVTIELITHEEWYNLASACDYTREIWGVNLYSTNIGDTIEMETAILDELKLVYNEKWYCYQVDLCKFEDSQDLTEIESDGSELDGQRKYMQFIIKRHTSQTLVTPVLQLRNTELIADYTLDDPIPTWRDASGNGYNAVQANASYQPAYKESPFESAKGDGSNDYLDLSAAIAGLSSNIKGAIHINLKGFGAYQGLFDFTNSGPYTGLVCFISPAEELDIGFYVNGVTKWRHTSAFSSSTEYDIKIIQNGITPKIYSNDVDITNLVTTTDTTLWFADITSWNTANLFYTNIGFDVIFGSGYIDYFTIYDTNLTVEQMNCNQP